MLLKQYFLLFITLTICVDVSGELIIPSKPGQISIAGYEVIPNNNTDQSDFVNESQKALIEYSCTFQDWMQRKFVLLHCPPQLTLTNTSIPQKQFWTNPQSPLVNLGSRERWYKWGTQGEQPDFDQIQGQTITAVFCERRIAKFTDRSSADSRLANLMFTNPVNTTYETRFIVDKSNEIIQWSLNLAENKSSPEISNRFPIGLVPLEVIEKIKNKLLKQTIWSICAYEKVEGINQGRKIKPLSTYKVNDVGTGDSPEFPIRLFLIDDESRQLISDVAFDNKFYYSFWIKDPAIALRISPQNKESIISQKLLPGMSRSEVQIAWGMPNSVWIGASRDDSELEIFQYNHSPSKGNYNKPPHSYVVFKSGKLINIVF